MADQIAASLRHEKDLVASVSHELRAPLSRIRMAVELLADGRDLSDAARSHLQSIAEEVGELDGLIEELLTRARLESAGFVLEREDVDLCELAREVVKRTGSAADRVDMELSPGIVPVRGSRTLLARALRNVLENALQYSAPETRVRLSVREDGRRAVVRIEDRGVGIPPEEVPRVFEPFFRGERSRSRRTGGVGFGLTLTREIVRRHGGEIDIASTVGAGTTVTLSLPRG
jgi:signal transduction histidine kinase